MNKVVAIKSFKDGIMYSYGEGIVSEEIPNIEPFKSAGITNPCIKLDSGKLVWGFMCWWGPKKTIEERYGPQTKETILVEPQQEVSIYNPENQ